ncbi:MAG: dehydrogenase [Archangium gephyra]|uniref:Dehydrogenase n=1 Tax=Archangium gephyra TaxID=48 RepID=A0A2W5SKM2_9BACT|nr:MAG: dehydrogenase [Archangium gephyra]
MRVLAIVKASKESEESVAPSTEEMLEMGRFNDEMIKSGIMLAGEGLLPSKKGVRVMYEGKKRAVMDGPFAETKELVAGFWILQVKSMEEAVEWLKRAPFHEGNVELRPIAEMEDFGEAMTPEVRAQEERQRRELESQKRK